MRIMILGCGAMGTVMGAYLTRNGCGVELVDAYAAHVAALQANGARVTGCVDFSVPVHAYVPEEMTGFYDLVFLFTKQTANRTVLPQLCAHLKPDSIVCTLQNGVPEPFVAKYVGAERTVGGTVLWGANFLGPGVSELTQDIGKRDFLYEIGETDGRITPRIHETAAILNLMGPTEISSNLMDSRWSKLMANACMSAMSAVCGCPFGAVLSNDRARACLSYLGREVKLCCEAAGYRLENPDASSLALESQLQFDQSQRMFHDIYDCQPLAKASMLQDLEKGRETEVTMINGFVCDTGDRFGIKTPFNDTVVRIVTAIERGELTLSTDNLNLFPQHPW